METKEGLVDFNRAKSVPVETVVIKLDLTDKLSKKQVKGKDEWSGFCPFGEHGKKGCFSINNESGAFICHACKRKGGNVLEFVNQYMQAHPDQFESTGLKAAGQWLINLAEQTESTKAGESDQVTEAVDRNVATLSEKDHALGQAFMLANANWLGDLLMIADNRQALAHRIASAVINFGDKES